MNILKDDVVILDEDIEIITIQKKIMKLGWQWEERIYNDGDSRNCSVKLTRDTDPCALSVGLGELGWGRFSRIYCWRAIAESIIN